MTEQTAQDASPQSSTSPRKQQSNTIFSTYPFNWEEVHAELLAGRYSGVYGWDHAAYWGIAEKKQQINLTDFYKRRSDDEFYLPEWKELLDNPETRRHWGRIVTFDPLGMYGQPPTIASCRATLTIPELMDLDRDGVIVDSEGGIKCSKAAVYYAWNIAHLAERLQLSEGELRDALHKYSNDSKTLDPNIKVHLPAVGGFTVYAFGDVRKIRDPNTEIAVRVHDECIGSDVFGSDICTCRPYLMFAMRHAVECAQRGGVGIVVYYRKEGRSLGEVIKFRVYNARINQKGGDRPEMYFHQTESIAGIRDARFQTMMSDALVWMGISRIDWLLSMSAEKYDAIVEAGIQVMQRVSLPDDFVPKAASVEIDAKVASGYHAEFVDKDSITQKLLDPASIRERCGKIYGLALKKQLGHWTLDESKLPAVVDLVADVMTKTYGSVMPAIPNHSRLGHFRPTVFQPLVQETWRKLSGLEKTRRLVDLCTVSVILDAGAGTQWKYVCPFEGTQYKRSEGIAQATLDMFIEGKFSSDAAVKTRVNSTGLAKLAADELKHGFHVRADNAILGLDQRLGLLHRLAAALEQNPDIFASPEGEELCRPGHLVDWLLASASSTGSSSAGAAVREISALTLWKGLIRSLTAVWPSSGRGWLIGDCWMHSKLKSPKEPGSDLIPFHKLTQWLAYTIMDVMEQHLPGGVRFTDQDALTALAEYRNGGLLVDAGVLTLKNPLMQQKKFAVGAELVVEWRALTVVLIDKVADAIRKRFAHNFTMSQILEGGTWRAGRQLAFKLRPQDGAPPVVIESDGTVF